jgi:predicted ATP-dependent serine protease
VRSVSQPDLRAREAAALGFRRVIVPQTNAGEIRADVDVLPVKRVEDVSALLFL